MSNPIQSTDLYQPGAQDTIASLQKQLVQLQSEMKGIVGLARQMKTVLAGTQGIGGKEKITDFAQQTEKLRQQQERTKQAYARTQIALQRLTITQNQAAASANRLAISESQAAAAALRLEVATKRADGATKKHSGSLTGLIGSIRNLAYAYLSLGAAAQVFQSILKQTKALDTLTVAFNTTLGSAQATAQAQEYLLDISERFGANLLGASQAYLKFSAASTQAGVSAEETQKIFTSVTKASSILGLGAERTSYVFLALEQIMSKGRLSTEELRRQLGEHLPGAFGIAAEAMGVTTAKLTDMLKKGEIASTDFLPKFAVQLEKAYGIDQVERIDNLAAAQERFNNQLTLLIKDLDLSDAFKDLFKSLVDGLKFIRQNIEPISKLTKAVFQLVVAWVAYKAIMIANNALTTFFLVNSLRQLTMTKALEAAQLRLSLAVQRLNLAWKTNPLGLIAAAAAALIVVINLLDKRLNATAEFQKALADATAKASAEAEFQAFSLNRLVGEYAKNEAALLGLKEGTDEYNKISDIQKGLLTELNNLGVIATDVNGDHKISIDELTTAKANYIQKLEEEIYLEELNARLKEAISKRIDLKQKIENFDPKSVLLNPNNIFAAAGTTKELENVNILIDKIKAEILSRKKDFTIAPKVVGGNGGDDESGDGKGKKNTFDAEKERLDLVLNNQARELAELKLAYERKKADFIANKEDTNALEEKYQYDRSQIINKYLDIEIQAYLDAEEDKRAAFKKATEDVVAYLDERRQAIADAEAKRQANVDFFRDEFSARREHEKAIFDLTTHTKEETLAFELKLKEDELNDELQLHRTFGKVLSDEEVKRVTELRDRTKAARVAGGIVGDLQGFFKDNNGSDKKEEVTDIFSLLGIDFGGDNEKLDAFKQTIAFVGGELSNFLDFQKEIVDQQIENADRLVRNAENNLTRQIELQVAGQANNVAGAQAELALAKKTQEEALKQRRKTQKQELALDTLSQSSNLITAVTAALKLGPILGPIAVGAILATFAVSKIKALQLINKKTFRKGGFREIGGGSHESGNDTHVGGNNWAEKDESVGIFTAKATRKYKPSLKAIVNAANKGTLENILVQDRRAIQGINMTNRLDIDTSLMEKRLTRLVSLSETKTFVDGRGRLVKIDRGRTTIINR